MGSRRTTGTLDLDSYLRQTRGVSVSFAYLLPLLAAYEVGILLSGSGLRNSAELSLKQAAGLFGGCAIWVQHGVLAATLVVALRLAFSEVPALRLYPVFLLESALLALLIGPAVAAVLGTVGLRSGPVDGTASGTEHVLLSIGAGVYEELVFRFLLLAGGFVLLHRGFALGRKTSFAVATGISALLFAAYHHVGPYGEPYRPAVFAFRASAGVILGLLLAGRGLALCAYLHAFYDILCDLGRGAETP